MDKIFDSPKFKYGDNPPAVYKISFNTGHFYIGGTKRFKTRISSWKTKIKLGTYKNRLMREVMPQVSHVKIELIERTKDDNFIERETYYIGLYIKNEMSLNQCASGCNRKGSKLPLHLRKIDKPKFRYKDIIDQNTGIFYTSHELAFLLGCTIKKVWRILSEERKPNTTQYRYA